MSKREKIRYLLSLTTWETEPFKRLTRLQIFLFEVVVASLFVALGYIGGREGIEGPAAVLGFGFACGGALYCVEYGIYSLKKYLRDEDN
jgi:hypothetical protein